MGFKIKSLIDNVKKPITIDNLFNKTITVDAFNYLYQFLHAFRGKNNTLLKNHNGDVTSHLSGLFYRCFKLLDHNIRPIFCYDGLKKEHKNRWDVVEKKIKLTEDMIKTSKELLDYMGISYIQTPSEGEAQCVYLTKKHENIWGISSQDYDVLLYGGERFIRNLSVSRTRIINNVKTNIDIEYISLNKFLEYNKLTQNQLIDLSILIGNDYFNGIYGIGEKKGIKLIQNNGSIENIYNIELKVKIKKDVEVIYTKDEFMDIVYKLRNIFTNPKIEKNYDLKKKKIDYDKIIEFMVEKNNFDEKRIKSVVNKIRTSNLELKQQTMNDFFKKKDTTNNYKKNNDLNESIKTKTIKKKSLKNTNSFI